MRNKTRDQEQKRARKYKTAFDTVFGDPWKIINRADFVTGDSEEDEEKGDLAFRRAHEATEGLYNVLSKRSSISAVDNSKEHSSGGTNVSRPSPMDFLIDVEQALDKAFEKYAKHANDMKIAFALTYIQGVIDDPLSIKKKGRKRAELEQLVGRFLRARRIYPTATWDGKGYFDCPRKRKPRDAV